MTSYYRSLRENPHRRATSPCYLVPPLAESWRVQWRHRPGTLAVIDAGLVFVERPDGRLSARSEGSAEERWVGPSGSPALVHRGRVLTWVDANHAAFLSCETGLVAEVIDCPAPVHVDVVGDRLVGNTYEQDRGGYLFARPLSAGLEWEHPISDGVFMTSMFAAGDDRMIVGTDDGSLACLSISSGEQFWSANVRDLAWDDLGTKRSGYAQGVLVLHAEVVIVEVLKHYVVALSLKDGRRVWTWRVPEGTVWQGYLYGDQYHVLGGLGSYYVLDPVTGEQLFEANLRKTLPKKLSQDTPQAPLLMSETHIWTGALGPHVFAFDRKTGEYAWHYSPKGGGSTMFNGAYFMSVNGRLYYGDMAFRMYCLEEENPTDPVLTEQRARQSR